MLKRRWMTGAAAGLMLAAIWLLGAAAKPSESERGGIRIAYVDLFRVTAQSETLQQRVQNASDQVGEKQKSLRTKLKRRDELRDQLAKQESVLTAAQTERMKKELKQLQDDIEYLKYSIGRMVRTTPMEISESALDEIMKSVERVAEASKIDLVLNGDAVLYSTERVDLTKYVAQDLDRRLKAAGSSPVSSGAPARRSAPPPKKTKSGSPKKPNP